MPFPLNGTDVEVKPNGSSVTFKPAPSAAVTGVPVAPIAHETNYTEAVYSADPYSARGFSPKGVTGYYLVPKDGYNGPSIQIAADHVTTDAQSLTHVRLPENMPANYTLALSYSPNGVTIDKSGIEPLLQTTTVVHQPAQHHAPAPTDKPHDALATAQPTPAAGTVLSSYHEAVYAPSAGLTAKDVTAIQLVNKEGDSHPIDAKDINVDAQGNAHVRLPDNIAAGYTVALSHNANRVTIDKPGIQPIATGMVTSTATGHTLSERNLASVHFPTTGPQSTHIDALHTTAAKPLEVTPVMTAVATMPLMPVEGLATTAPAHATPEDGARATLAQTTMLDASAVSAFGRPPFLPSVNAMMPNNQFNYIPAVPGASFPTPEMAGVAVASAAALTAAQTQVTGATEGVATPEVSTAKRFDVVVPKVFDPATRDWAKPIVIDGTPEERAETDKYHVTRLSAADFNTGVPAKVELDYGAKQTYNDIIGTDRNNDKREAMFVAKEGGAMVAEPAGKVVDYTIKTADPSKFDFVVNTDPTQKHNVAYAIVQDPRTKEPLVNVMVDGKLDARLHFDTPDGKPLATLDPSKVNVLQPDANGEFVAAKFSQLVNKDEHPKLDFTHVPAGALPTGASVQGAGQSKELAAAR